MKRKGGFVWKGAQYVLSSGEYTEGKTIAKTKDGSQINEIEEDETHSFLVMRSFLDQDLYVREDYKVPEDAELLTVSWSDRKIDDDEFCSVVDAIIDDF